MFSHLYQGKTLLWIFTASLFAPFITFMESYVFCDWEFLKFLLILMVVDTITGFIKYFKLRAISSHGFGQLLLKIILYFSVLILTHVLTHFKVHGSVNVIFGWFDDFAYSALIVRESISILENFGVIMPGLIPKSILNKLREFDIHGKIKQD